MPILDPALQFYLCTNMNKTTSKNFENFFIEYLKIASCNLGTNFKTVLSYFAFKADINKIDIKFLNKIFNLKLTEEQLKDESIKNLYQFLYDQFNKKNVLNEIEGHYYIYKNLFKINLFQPFVSFPKYHSWYLTDSPIAILCINCKENYGFGLDMEYKLTPLICMEIDLIEAADLTPVLCVFSDLHSLDGEDYIAPLLKGHNFAEVHLNLFEDYTEYDKKIHRELDVLELKTSFLSIINAFNGYCYLYTQFLDDATLNIDEIINDFNLPRFKHFPFSDNLMTAFNYGEMSPDHNFAHKSLDFEYEIKKFVYCKTGFDQPRIKIMLSNVPIFNDKDPIKDPVPYDYSGLNFGYILKSNFLGSDGFRASILYNDTKNSNRLSNKFINFTDIHSIKIDFYVKDSLYLVDTDKKTLKDVLVIQSSSNNKLIENASDFKKENILSFFTESKIMKLMEYVSYAFTHYMTYSASLENFKLHTNQIFTALEACRKCILSKKSTKENHGVIYQVETGEGKSCIIILIAAVLALSKKTVHIASSNILLSNRDYYESFNFFKQIRLSSAVLLHQNELPKFDGQIQKSFYPEKFFNEKLFQNSSNMNYSVCGIDDNNIITDNKANIVFSTFINFESLYLKMMQMCPSYISKYFSDCSLLIDEADSILIDEIANGTILSRPMKTNCREVLTFIYKCYFDKKDAKYVLDKVKTKWPKCKDMTIENINDMFQEIDIVNQPDFINGKKYSIEKVKIEKEDINLIKEIKEIINTVKSAFIGNTVNKKPYYEFNKVVYFDYDNKGILEPNKEYSGFIQQFIAIKEMLNNKKYQNMIINDISMNYLYVSHPIFVNLYSKVIGLTGTIGNQHDKQIFSDHYQLTTKKIPRNKPNHRIELPMVICSDVEERNQHIVNDIIKFHKKENPILVIFQDLIEIYYVYELLKEKGIKNVNVFDGKSDMVKPDHIAGIKGEISLGTNFCSRGTDIKSPQLPLHVIITYYTTNSRVIHQAFGRTARNGKEGTVRIICLKKQYLLPTEIYESESLKNVLDDFSLKNKLQGNFIEDIRKTRNWIFSGNIKSQKIPSLYIEKMREARININRFIAFNFEFPICMSMDSFLLIQAQKIFSLFNCPNCKYLWILFQSYIREMILESWSLFINNVDKKYQKHVNEKISYSKFLESEYNKFKSKLEVYLPQSNKMQPEEYEIVPTFMHIFNIVIKNYQEKVMLSFPKSLTKCFHADGNERFCSFIIGFKPYLLVNQSGAKINNLDDTNQDLNYIQDPELKYIQKQPKGSKSILISITQAIDGIFNLICQKINEIIGNYTGLKFFMRRTLSGCEFGVCFDFEMKNIKGQILKDEICFVDKDPLLLFTINVKSQVPVMAGILIIGLVYIAKVAKTISEWITTFVAKFSIEIVKKSVKIVVEQLATKMLNNQISKFCDKIIDFMKQILKKQIDKLSLFNQEVASVFDILMKVVDRKDFKKSVNSINSLFGENSDFTMKSNIANELISNHLPVQHFLKIGLLLMLCFASFMMNFHYQRSSLNYDNDKAALNYDQNQSTQNALKENNKFVDLEKFEDQNDAEIELSDLYVNPDDYVVEVDEIGKGENCVVSLVHPKNNKNLKIALKRITFDVEDYNFQKNFIREITIMASLKHPNLIELVGFSFQTKSDKTYNIYSKYIPNKTLIKVLKEDQQLSKGAKTLNPTLLSIIVYGIASVMSYLHQNNIVHRDLKPDNVFLDENYYPVLSGLGSSRIYNEMKMTSKIGTPYFMAPEIFGDEEDKITKKIDVYSFAITLLSLFTTVYKFEGSQPKNLNQFVENIMNGKRYIIPKGIPKFYVTLINRCWKTIPSERPSFDQIIKELENSDDFLFPGAKKNEVHKYIIQMKNFNKTPKSQPMTESDTSYPEYDENEETQEFDFFSNAE